MNTKRWEFTGATKTVFGIVLRRIRATVDFTLKCGINVRAGELGGWIEKEENLSDNAWVSGNAQVFGDARVFGDAQVFGDARVFGDAQVYGNAQVSDNAWVSDNAQVFGDAWVYGNAWVYGDTQVFGDARVFGDAQVYGNAQVSDNAHYLLVGRIGSRADFTTFTRDKAGTIYVKCGCFYGTLAEFRAKVRETHGDNKHGRVYQVAADLAELQIDTTPIDDKEVDDD